MTASVHDVLETARQHHIKIMLNGDRLHLSAPNAPPDELLEQLRQWKPLIIRALSESRFRAWSFTLDNTRSVTAIRPNGATLEEMQRHLQNQFGADRVTNVRAQS
jgi:hypothetical protein